MTFSGIQNFSGLGFYLYEVDMFLCYKNIFYFYFILFYINICKLF
jgi:hypothetical protein